MKKQFLRFLLCAALLFSIVFSAHTALAASLSANAYTYTDPITGATFVVPDGWGRREFNVEDAANFFRVKFVSQNDSGSTILYGSYDLWDTMPASERSGHTRSQINNAYIYEDQTFIQSLVDFAPQEGATIEADDVQLVTYGRNEFIEIPLAREMSGSSSHTIIWHVENGYAYIFTLIAIHKIVNTHLDGRFPACLCPKILKYTKYSCDFGALTGKKSARRSAYRQFCELL